MTTKTVYNKNISYFTKYGKVLFISQMTHEMLFIVSVINNYNICYEALSFTSTRHSQVLSYGSKSK